MLNTVSKSDSVGTKNSNGYLPGIAAFILIRDQSSVMVPVTGVGGAAVRSRVAGRGGDRWVTLLQIDARPLLLARGSVLRNGL